MDKSSIRKEIAVLINSIKEQSDNIGDRQDIPQLELELILHKIEKLYQKSIVFNHLNLSKLETGNSTVSAKKVEQIIEKPNIDTPKIEPNQAAKMQASEIINKPMDLFGGDSNPVAENSIVEKKVQKKEEKPSASNIQKPAIEDLTKAIGLNDKFLFANELFAANMQEYSIAIQQLNTAESLESAMDYFSNLQQLYDWDLEREAVKRLLDLVDRRFS